MKYRASTNIRPARFVTISGDHLVAESNSGELPAGISGESLHDARDVVNTTFHALTGMPVRVHDYNGGDNDRAVMLTLGGTVTAGALLKPDNEGAALAAVSGDAYGARALQGGVAGEKVQVEVIVGTAP